MHSLPLSPATARILRAILRSIDSGPGHARFALHEALDALNAALGPETVPPAASAFWFTGTTDDCDRTRVTVQVPYPLI
ncbi:MAG: hypothetical protein L0191_01865 [Acidobacteria bacterium]|nr:hypothetical protein [Acidobacteriota bacterium]